MSFIFPSYDVADRLRSRYRFGPRSIVMRPFSATQGVPVTNGFGEVQPGYFATTAEMKWFESRLEMRVLRRSCKEACRPVRGDTDRSTSNVPPPEASRRPAQLSPVRGQRGVLARRFWRTGRDPGAASCSALTGIEVPGR
jgi:hypothetical protein